jgi:hypothetical protein
MTRVGTSLRFVGLMQSPTSETDGVATQDWKSVHVTFYADTATYAGLVATFRPWRWYPKQPDGQSGATGVEVGRWIPDFEVTVALDPARITAAITSHLAWPTRDASKMYWQLLGVWDAANNPGTVPAFVSAQMFGDATQNDTVAVSVSSAGGGVGTPCCPEEFTRLAGVKATHWSPNNGSATYLSAVTLTMAGFPFVVANANCLVAGVIVRKSTGVVVEYINGHDGVSISATADVVTITGAGAAPFLVTDLNYYVYLIAEEKAYTEATDSYRTEEIAPLNHEHTQPAYIVNDVAVVADPGATNVPSDDGIVMDGFKDIHFHIYLLGGKHDDATDCTVTLKFQGSNDVFIGGVRQWVDLGAGYDLNADSTASTWTSVGNTVFQTEIDFDNWMGKRIRAQYDWDKDPNGQGTPGAIVITERRKAL